MSSIQDCATPNCTSIKKHFDHPRSFIECTKKAIWAAEKLRDCSILEHDYYLEAGKNAIEYIGDINENTGLSCRSMGIEILIKGRHNLFKQYILAYEILNKPYVDESKNPNLESTVSIDNFAEAVRNYVSEIIIKAIWAGEKFNNSHQGDFNYYKEILESTTELLGEYHNNTYTFRAELEYDINTVDENLLDKYLDAVCMIGYSYSKEFEL